MALRTCVVCGLSFKASPSDKKVTCGKICSRVNKSRTHRGVRNTWPEEARARLAQQGQTPNLKAGTPAAKISPRSGPFETNVNARDWIVITPDGEEYAVRNLRLWCEQNAELFAPDTWQRAYSGMKRVAYWLRGMEPRQVSQWKGWKLRDGEDRA